MRVNAISPDSIATPGLAGLAPGEKESAALFAQLTSGVPLGRLGQPDEIARAVSFLASDDASYVTGIEHFVDGGVAQV